MFASLNLSVPTPIASIDAGGEPRAYSSSQFTTVPEGQASFSEILKLPPAIPVSANFGSGEALPEDGNGLPPATLLEDGNGLRPTTFPEEANGLPLATLPEDGDGWPLAILPEDGDGLPPATLPEDSDGLPLATLPEDGDGLPLATLPEDGDGLPLATLPKDGDGLTLATSTENGIGLPPATLPAQPALPEVKLLVPAIPGVTVDNESLTVNLDVDLTIDYPAQELQTDSLPQVALLPIAAEEAPKMLSPASTPNAPVATAANQPADDKPLPPPELLVPVRHLRERQEWVARRAEGGPVVASALQGLRNQSVRPTAEVPTANLSDADGATADQEIPAVTTLTRAVAAFETLRQLDTRLAGTNATAASTTAHLAATPGHIAATLSQFAGEPPGLRSDTLAAQIGTPVRDAAWGEKLGERVMLLTGHQIKSADIRLTPADLGPLRVQLRIDDGIANVTFHAQHAVTRDAIEQALPRLREMMAESGLSLGQADVSERGVSGGDAEQDGSHASGARANADDATDHPVEIELPQRRKTARVDGLVDTFA